ncbi:ABC transporter permease [Cellulomonas sp. PhB150]|uniref:ABC transporter permease n=1 Tax=Cellulomonas sp. PhB150 TaxID=2485188 RepID=UPI001F434D76|nr:multidrug ABC transporter permease [Cellulomonas sp. PhB150]
MFPTEESRQQLAATIGANPALAIIFGPANDLSTADGFNTWRCLALGGFLTALMAIFVVTKASRGQEDSGQAELLASGVMSRATRLSVAVLMAAIASLVLGVVCAVATGLCGGDWQAAWLLSATFTASGWMFAALTAVAAQLGSDARTTSTLAVATLGTLFVARGYFDSIEAPSWTNWLTPQGWMEYTQPGIDNIWWPLLLAIAFTAVVLVVAFTLQARRDFGQGAISPRPGPAVGRVRSSSALAWRINRSPLISWTIAFLLLGAIFGTLATSVPDLLAGDATISGLLASGAITPDDIVGEFLVTMLSMIGIIASVGGVQTMLKVRSEEMDDRVEPLLAGAVARTRYYSAHIVVALVGPTIGLLVAGLMVALVASSSDLGVSFGDVWLQAASIVPAAWTVVALAVLVVGARPQVEIAAWAGVLASFGLTLLGPTFGLDDWVLGISPFWHVPHLIAGPTDWTGLGWITLFTIGFIAIGTLGFRRRDLARV